MSGSFHVGQRLCIAGGSHDGALCTVRYVGEVLGGKGKEWLGIEYDDPSLGKHDGNLEGTVYFICMSPASNQIPPSLHFAHRDRNS